MLEYVVKRLLRFIPALFIITLCGFTLLVNSPGDPLDALVDPLNSAHINGVDMERQKAHWRQQLGLNLPLFYISVTQLSEPDTLYKLHDKQQLKIYKSLLNQTGNASAITDFIQALSCCKQEFAKELSMPDTSITDITQQTQKLQLTGEHLHLLSLQTDLELMEISVQAIAAEKNAYSSAFNTQVQQLLTAFKTLTTHKSLYKNYIPKISWHGAQNRYHQWLFGNAYCKGVIRGDFGISYIKKEPVIAIIKDKIIWSLLFSILSIILAYAISIPIGISMASRPGSKRSRLSELILLTLYSMPSFFVGVLLLMLFANPDVLSIFPPSGIKPIGGYSNDTNLFEKCMESLPYLILPLICYTYSSVAFISQLTNTTLQEQLPFDYIKTAKAKGLSHRAIILKHALKNSLLPLITVFSALFPAMIGGSVIIESMFTIPGMGLETVKAVISKDYPVVIAIITVSSLLTMFSYLLADILYAWVDPRIRHT